MVVTSFDDVPVTVFEMATDAHVFEICDFPRYTSPIHNGQLRITSYNKCTLIYMPNITNNVNDVHH